MTVDDSRKVRLAHVRLQNTSADRGGVVDINRDGTLILEASGIASGTAGTAGGGVYVGVGASLIMREGSAVFANSVTETTLPGWRDLCHQRDDHHDRQLCGANLSLVREIRLPTGAAASSWIGALSIWITP